MLCFSTDETKNKACSKVYVTVDVENNPLTVFSLSQEIITVQHKGHVSLVCTTEVSSHQVMRTFFFLLRKGHRIFEVVVACFNEAVHNLQTNAYYKSCNQKNNSSSSRSVNNACIKYCFKRTHTSSKSVFVDFAIDCTFSRISVSNSSTLMASSCKADIRTSTHSPFKL